MARKKISEFRAKTILTSALGMSYDGVAFNVESDDFSSLEQLDNAKTYVVKVDEGVKKRMKQGLIALNKKPSELAEEIKKLQEKGYTHFIIEPFLPHDQSAEKYFSVQLVREGLQVLFSHKGGIDIESNQDAVVSSVITNSETAEAFIMSVGLDKSFLVTLKAVKEVSEIYYFSFIEINPLVIDKDAYTFLDLAAEVDSTAAFFVQNIWTENDFRSGITKAKTDEEKAIQALADKSQAAFSLEVLNPDGNIFMMLSGGGASIVLADEVYNQGYGKQLANYGEYSGNPNAEETYLYAKNILSLLLHSKAEKKVLIIAGGVANFTDVRITFKGLIKALEEVKDELKKQGVKIFVRRGGPYQEEGLHMMKAFLKEAALLGVVAGPEMILTDIVTEAITFIK